MTPIHEIMQQTNHYRIVRPWGTRIVLLHNPTLLVAVWDADNGSYNQAPTPRSRMSVWSVTEEATMDSAFLDNVEDVGTRTATDVVVRYPALGIHTRYRTREASRAFAHWIRNNIENE